MADMLTAREAHSVVYNNGFVYVLGGKPDLSLCERYNCSTRVWNFIGTMHYPRWDSSAVVYKQFIFVIGGVPAPAGTKIERYNTELDMWNIIPVQLPKPLSRVPVFVAPRDRIAILGG